MDDDAPPCRRLMCEVELALTASETDPVCRRRQEAEAARRGLTGAEVDAARAGRSFDARAAAAIALALACRSGDDGVIGAATRRAAQAGLGPVAQRTIRDAASGPTVPTTCAAAAEPATPIRTARR
ncbi:hypothetical protein FHS96_003052 [Sphingomonas zeicaulis]|uniref:hypothetical protein n=1 Tax=Sphingomonas zeicaulis TaxID=1632740 RepID=UPI003D21D95A